MWEHPDDLGNSHRMVSFFKLVEPLDIWIGTGEYYEDFQHEQQQEILERIKRISFVKGVSSWNWMVGDEVDQLLYKAKNNGRNRIEI